LERDLHKVEVGIRNRGTAVLKWSEGSCQPLINPPGRKRITLVIGKPPKKIEITVSVGARGASDEIYRGAKLRKWSSGLPAKKGIECMGQNVRQKTLNLLQEGIGL